MSDMRQMKMKRDKLLAALCENRDEHRAKFLEAQSGYREAVIEELDRMLADARAGNAIKRAVSWPEPQDHTADYDHAIRMLQFCVDEEIDISAEDFERLVMDEWGWKAQWTQTTANYVR